MINCAECGKVIEGNVSVNAKLHLRANSKNWMFHDGECVKKFERNQAIQLGVVVEVEKKVVPVEEETKKVEGK